MLNIRQAVDDYLYHSKKHKNETCKKASENNISTRQTSTLSNISALKKRSRGSFSEYAAKRRLSHNLNTQVSIKDFSSSGYGHTQVFKHSNKHALSCLLWHRLKHTNLKCTALSSWVLTRHSIQSSKLSCATSQGCETR